MSIQQSGIDIVRVQHDDFDVGDEYNALAQTTQAGAIVTFTGKVRDMNLGESVTSLTLEHYPGMTEKSLASIIVQAKSRWPLFSVTVIHRIGHLSSGDQIVFVGVSSAHRGAAFQACEFIMDYLKTEAPFWKKEVREGQSTWVDARESDHQARERW
ncbi:molybdopterin synthase catalytic subunit MoaE [Photobacterium galatheae]|uniref:molybdopterin synthase catalytic subunit MoaE n=1 Tax=Photobacterium galatheae TaxID=1654360 RepID=UPI00202CE264|nr:molybdopterin synthase catalytic subunit MoaE [Photobacterium galatheae]MCM0147458.1 molybdopterin synthase catalytic subunit MoaE [Photobacterium galatheae]